MLEGERKESITSLPTPTPIPGLFELVLCIRSCGGLSLHSRFWILGALEVWRTLCLYFGSVQGLTPLQNPHSASSAPLCLLGEEKEDLAQRGREGWAAGGGGRQGPRANQKHCFRITSTACPMITVITQVVKEPARSHGTKEWQSWDWNSGLRVRVSESESERVRIMPRKSPRLLDSRLRGLCHWPVALRLSWQSWWSTQASDQQATAGSLHRADSSLRRWCNLIRKH